MHYSNIEKGIFLSRPNRFLAHVVVDGKEVVCHVKNTGRCKELLIPNCEVYVQHHDNPNRKTEYSLISVQKGNRLVNIDSQAQYCCERMVGAQSNNTADTKNLS